MQPQAHQQPDVLPCSRPRACIQDAQRAPLLVYHPQGGLSNCLFGLSSAALLATALCRRFAVAWGHNVNRQAGASFAALFQRPVGIAFLNESEGSDTIALLGQVQPTGALCTLQLNLHWNRSQALSSLLPGRGGEGEMLASRCPVLHVRGNLYYAPILERDLRVARAGRWLRSQGLGCNGDTLSSSRRVGEPYFAAVSRHLFVPHGAASARADFLSARKSSEAVIGVHVRSTILLALHKDRRDAACGQSVDCEHILRAYGFLECVAKVRNASAVAGYASSRVYMAADNAMVRTEARKVWGKQDLVPTPAYLYTGREMRGKMVTTRGALATAGAVDEMLLLERTDGIVVWDLKESTYSASAASWAARRAGGHAAGAGSERTRRAWLGVHIASRGCEQIPNALVDPPVHDAVLAGEWNAAMLTVEIARPSS